MARSLERGDRSGNEKYVVDSIPIGDVKSNELLIRHEPDENRVWVYARAWGDWLRKRADYMGTMRKLAISGRLIDTKQKQMLAGWKEIDSKSNIGVLRCHEFWTGPMDEKPWSKLQGKLGVPEPKPKPRLPDNPEKLKALSQKAP